MDRSTVITAGAYVLLPDHIVPFVVGPSSDGTALAVVRLGGHCEGTETAWECAQREVFEEARLKIHPLESPITFHCPPPRTPGAIDLQPTEGVQMQEYEPRPLIINQRNTIPKTFSAMYLATSNDEPTPSMETKGLLLLTRTEIYRITKESLTLSEYESMGGQFIANEELNRELPLQPYPQLIMLARILEHYPEVIPAF